MKAPTKWTVTKGTKLFIAATQLQDVADYINRASKEGFKTELKMRTKYFIVHVS